MTPPLPINLTLLKQACQKYGYTFRIIDEHSKTLAEVSKGKKTFLAGTAGIGLYPLNPHFASELAKDKAFCYKILKDKGYKIPTGDYFFVNDFFKEKRATGKERKEAMAYAEQLGYPLFVKPNSYSKGYLAKRIQSAQELENQLDQIAKFDYIAILQQIIEQPNYRFFVLDGKVL